MRKKLALFAWIFAAAMVTSCGGGKTTEGSKNDSDSVAAAVKADKPHADPSKKNEYTAKLGGKEYEIVINRTADESEDVVTDEMGTKFYDNRVDVTVVCGSEQIFKKSYTKSSFSEFLTSAADRDGTVLLGMAYDSEKSDGHAIRLGAQIGQVGIEEGPAFTVEIPLDGGASSIVRDKRQDTTGDDGLSD